jgi:hypothetical protein
LSSNLATFVFDLDPKRQQTLLLEISCDRAGAGEALHRGIFCALRQARRVLRTSSSRAAATITANDIFNENPSSFDLGPLHADHGDARGALPLRWNPVV